MKLRTSCLTLACVCVLRLAFAFIHAFYHAGVRHIERSEPLGIGSCPQGRRIAARGASTRLLWRSMGATNFARLHSRTGSSGVARSVMTVAGACSRAHANRNLRTRIPATSEAAWPSSSWEKGQQRLLMHLRACLKSASAAPSPPPVVTCTYAPSANLHLRGQVLQWKPHQCILALVTVYMHLFRALGSWFINIQVWL